MNHNLTIGHLDSRAIEERSAVVLRPLDEAVVARHLKALGRRSQGRWTLDGMRVDWTDGYVVCLWLVGLRRNFTAEEFALRLQRDTLQRDTGCLIADREHGRIIDPATLVGLPQEPRRPVFPRARRLLKAMGL